MTADLNVFQNEWDMKKSIELDYMRNETVDDITL